MGKNRKPKGKTSVTPEVAGVLARMPTEAELTDAGGIFETKLTRGEAIDLMVDEASRQASRQIEALKAKISELNQISVEEMQELAGLAVSVGSPFEAYGRSLHQEENATNVRFSVVNRDLPRWFRDRQAEINVLAAQREEWERVRSALSDKTSAKLAILRQVLESSEDGRTFLKRVGTMSIGLQGRLLAAAKEERGGRR